MEHTLLRKILSQLNFELEHGAREGILLTVKCHSQAFRYCPKESLGKP